MNYYSLSLSDLILVDGFAEAYGANNEPTMKGCMWKCGMDTTQKVEEEMVEHRNLQNQVVTCIRYSGYERTDRAWLKTGVASLEAIIASTDDKGLQRELRIMSREISSEGFTWSPFDENI